MNNRIYGWLFEDLQVLRKGPGLHSEMLYLSPKLQKGEKVEVLRVVSGEDDCPWYYVRIAGGAEGYIDSRYIFGTGDLVY